MRADRVEPVVDDILLLILGRSLRTRRNRSYRTMRRGFDGPNGRRDAFVFAMLVLCFEVMVFFDLVVPFRDFFGTLRTLQIVYYGLGAIVRFIGRLSYSRWFTTARRNLLQSASQ